MPYTVDAVEPSAMSESMLGPPWARVVKPTRKNLKLTKITGNSSRNWVNAKISVFSSPRNTAGSGQPNIWPIDR